MADETLLYKRKASLLVIKPGTGASEGGENYDSQRTALPAQGLDLSEMHFQFQTVNADDEGPDNCVIRVYNLSRETVETLIKFNYSKVVLQAGYESLYGVIFEGDIKQFRVGRLDGRDTFLDILAANGDLAYTFGTVNKTLAAPETAQSNIVRAATDAFKTYGIEVGQNLAQTGGTLPRAKVMYGMARTFMGDAARSAGATWSINDGKVNILPLDGYLPGEAVKLNAQTGLLGVPEQTQLGIECRCLLNPKIRIGARVQIDNRLITETVSVAPTNGGSQIAFNTYTGTQNFANIDKTDGFYRVYVCEHNGDTRGNEWESKLILLAIDPTKPFNPGIEVRFGGFDGTGND